MEFCPKCGSVLEEKRKKFGCVRCGYTAKGKIKIISNEYYNEHTFFVFLCLIYYDPFYNSFYRCLLWYLFLYSKAQTKRRNKK